LNWRIVPRAWLLPDLSEAVWARLGKLPLAGIDVPWLSPEDLLLVLCLHGCKHKWERLKWIFDVAELVRVHPSLNWRGLMTHAHDIGAERMLAVSILLAVDLLDAPFLQELLK